MKSSGDGGDSEVVDFVNLGSFRSGISVFFGFLKKLSGNFDFWKYSEIFQKPILRFSTPVSCSLGTHYFRCYQSLPSFNPHLFISS